jgi:hypothetical protein
MAMPQHVGPARSGLSGIDRRLSFAVRRVASRRAARRRFPQGRVLARAHTVGQGGLRHDLPQEFSFVAAIACSILNGRRLLAINVLHRNIEALH